MSYTSSAEFTGPAHAVDQPPQMRGRQRQLAHLDAERSERRHRIGGRRRHRHHAALARTLGAERIGLERRSSMVMARTLGKSQASGTR